jgi:hypothetical protein
MHPNVQEQLSSPDQSFTMAPDDTTAAGIEYAYQADFNSIIAAAIQVMRLWGLKWKDENRVKRW